MPSVAAPVVRVPGGPRSTHAFDPPLSGKVRFETIESQVLRGNPLGDPSSRTLACYTPPSGRTEGKPLLVFLPGFTGSGWAWFQRATFLGEPIPYLLERTIREGTCGEATVIAPDCLTTLGGSQYVNSSAVGRYEDHVVSEVVPWAKERFRPSGVGVLGQSSGGFGALHLAFRHPQVFQAAGSSSGDMAFEYSYLPDFPKAAREFTRAGGASAWLGKFLEDTTLVKGPTDPSGAALNALAMASCYSPRPGEGAAFDLPFDERSGELVPEVWKRWLEFDPVTRLRGEKERNALLRSKLIHLTASSPDEWALDVGARIFSAEAKRQGVPVLHEEFSGGHFTAGPRFESLFAHLVAALSASG